jgi:acetylornithine/succinyldiaminopimelate/putrescine aminotransferase
VPVGAVLARKQIFNKVFDRMERAVAHGSTFGGNDLAMAAGIATLDVLASERLIENAARHTIKLLPALVISDADCDAILKAFAAVLAESERVPGAVWALGKALVGNALRASA